MSVYWNLVRDALTELASREMQEMLWSGRDDAAMSSFTECIEMLFDDSLLGDALDAGEVASSSVDDIYRALRHAVDVVDGNLPFERLIVDPRLERCRQLSSEVLSLRPGHVA